MRWTHLPAPGGIYDQHPKLLDDFQVIMEIEAKVERQRQEREKRSQRQRGKR